MQPKMLLPDFHKVIQTTMGWTNSHLHQFTKDRTFYAPSHPDDDFWDDTDVVEYSETSIQDLLQNEKDRVMYEYDFGDGWEHDILLEKILPDKGEIKTPVCTAGKLSCPPEDCGGVWGYASMLEILNDPKHEEHKTYLEWLGGEFDPEQFDREEVNTMLQEKDFGVIDIFD